MKRRIYKTIYNEDVREGSFVILKVYHLARAERLDGKGIIMWVTFVDLSLLELMAPMQIYRD